MWSADQDASCLSLGCGTRELQHRPYLDFVLQHLEGLFQGLKLDRITPFVRVCSSQLDPESLPDLRSIPSRQVLQGVSGSQASSGVACTHLSVAGRVGDPEYAV